MAEKAKPRRPSTSKRSPWHQDHAKMNDHILGNVMAMKRWSDEKVVNCIHAKTRHEWDKMVIVQEQSSPLPKLILVKSASKQLLQILGLNA